jgi:ornithine cyclodeaminase/alanine dehydrogenase-like protein (mu-crystallin family)
MHHNPPFITAEHLGRLLSGREAVDALETTLLARGLETINQAHRVILEQPQGDFFVMPATGPEGAGAKLVTLVPANRDRELPLVNGVYVLFTPDTLMLEAMIDGGALTALRTAAVSALAARHLAAPNSNRLAIFGAGAQAESHATVFSEALPITQITIIGRNVGGRRTHAAVARLQNKGLNARVGTAEDIAQAELICTCTTSSVPVFDGELVGPGTHITAVGAYRRDRRELDDELFSRAMLVVETRDAALKEAGDMIHALQTGALATSDLAHELRDVLTGRTRRTSPEQITIFKSVGLPIEDLIIARAAAENLAKRVEPTEGNHHGPAHPPNGGIERENEQSADH